MVRPRELRKRRDYDDHLYRDRNDATRGEMNKPKSVATKVLHNSFWIGVETITEMIVMTATSIAVARVLGPELFGHYTAVFYPMAILQNLAGAALGFATCKFMVERLAIGEVELAKSVYQYNFRIQVWLGAFVTAALIGLVHVFVLPANRPMGWIIAASTLPAFFCALGAQANLAHEDTSKNAWSALAYIFVNALLIMVSLIRGWGLTGIAVAWTASHALEAALRIVPLHFRFRKIPLQTLSGDEKANIRRFATQALGVQVLTTIVWSRSELMLLSWLSTAKQVAFYGVASGLAEKLQIAPSILGGGLGISMMAESVRARDSIDRLVASALRFLSFIALPLCLGAVAVAGAAVSVIYGHRYDPAIPVMRIAALFAIFRAYLCVPDALLRIGDNQAGLIRCMVLAGIVNMGLDIPLIFKWGAAGAAVGNGVGQALGVILIWIVAARQFSFGISWKVQARFFAAALIPAISAATIIHLFPNIPGLCVGILIAVPMYPLFLRLFAAFEPSDLQKLRQISDRLPGVLGKLAWKLFSFCVNGHELPTSVKVSSVSN